MSKLIITTFAFALSLAMLSTAKAAIITHDGSTIFGDDFEGVTGTTADTTDDADPVATIGNWIQGEIYPQNIQVLYDGGAEAFQPSSAYQGDQWLSMFRAGGGLGAWAIADLGTVSSGMLVTDFMFYVGQNSFNNPGGFFLTKTNTDHNSAYNDKVYYLALTDPEVDGTGYLNAAVGGEPGSEEFVEFASTGQTYTVGSWHRLTIETDIDAWTTTVSIDGATPTSVDMWDEGPVTGFMLKPNGNNQALALDAVGTVVPEPSTMMLLVAGIACCVGFFIRQK